MINKPGGAKTGYPKEHTARKKTGQGVTKSVESLKINSQWFSRHLEPNKNGLNEMSQGRP